MMVLLSFVAVTVFLLGLYQWAQGGASLWRIFRLRKMEKDLPSEERRQAEREVKQLEQAADRTIGASFRIIAILAVMVWVFLGLQMILEMFGINMIGRITSTARTYWSQPGTQTNQTSTQARNDMIRNLGTNLRR